MGARMAIAVVRAYQVTLGVWIGGRCRFYPSCSAYAVDAFARHPFRRALGMTIRRVGRCHPWGGHGVDPVEDPEPAGSGKVGEGGSSGVPIGAEPNRSPCVRGSE